MDFSFPSSLVYDHFSPGFFDFTFSDFLFVLCLVTFSSESSVNIYFSIKKLVAHTEEEVDFIAA